ncbi:MAG: DUF433 domain-containing protein [Chloroflexi bacterium]|nr:DUF433 domain-containing protein [Chloroflexota bacterium]
MSTVVIERQKEPWFRRLFLPAYPIGDAARYTKTNPRTVLYWYFGEKPVLPERERHKPLNYLQLVELAFVAFFRRIGIPMERIRAARDYIAQNFGNEYPLTLDKFKTEGYHILMEYQQFENIKEFDRVIVTDRGGQLAWDSLMGDKFAEFDYDYEIAMRWHPAGRQSLVLIDPRIAFGAPMVSGIPTWVLKGRWKAGETPEEMRDEFELTSQAVTDALRFEGIRLNGDSVLG